MYNSGAKRLIERGYKTLQRIAVTREMRGEER
jgi:hypothetical protein